MTALWDTAHLRRDLYSFAAHLFAAEVTSSLYRRLTSGAFEPTADARTLVFVEPELRALDEDRAVEELAIDYCRLFVGPRAMCPPYASVYRGEALLGGRAEARLDAFMREHGLGVSGQAARIASEDHAAIQLAVLSSLYERVVEVRGRTDQRDIHLATIGEFIGAHVLPWMPVFLGDVSNCAERALYSSLAQVVTGLLDGEPAPVGRTTRPTAAATRPTSKISWSDPFSK